MKKIIILSLIASFALADYSRTTVERAKEKEEYKKNDSIRFIGVIYNVKEYREYTEVTIATKEHGRIRTKLNSNRFMEGQKVSGNCSNYNYGMYESCNVYSAY